MVRVAMRVRCSHGGPRCLKCAEFELYSYAEKGAPRVQRADGVMDLPESAKRETTRLVAIQLQAAQQANGGARYFDGLIHSGALRTLAGIVQRTYKAALKKGAGEEAAEKQALAAALAAAEKQALAAALAAGSGKRQKSWALKK